MDTLLVSEWPLQLPACSITAAPIQSSSGQVCKSLFKFAVQLSSSEIECPELAVLTTDTITANLNHSCANVTGSNCIWVWSRSTTHVVSCTRAVKVAESCVAGNYCPDNTTSLHCLPGTFRGVNDSSKNCTRCPDGTTTGQQIGGRVAATATVCFFNGDVPEKCSAREYPANQTTCVPYPQDWYQDQPNQLECQPYKGGHTNGVV